MMLTPSGHSKKSLSVLPIAAAAYTCTWATDIVPVAGVPLFAAFSFMGLWALLAHILLTRKMRRASAVDALVALFIVWITLSCIWSADTASSFRMIYYYVLSFILFLQIEHVTVVESAWRKVAWAFVLGAVTAGVLLIAEVVLTGASDSHRGTIGNINANYIAYSLATAIPIAFALASTGSQGGAPKFLTGLLLVVLVTGTMVTGSRSGLLAAAVGIVGHSMLHARRNLVVTIIGIFAIAVASFLFYDFLPEGLRIRLDLISLIIERGQNVNANLSGRLDVLPLALEYFKANFIAGIGIGAFAVVNPHGFGAHNLPLSLAAEVGLIGFVLYLAIVVAIARQAVSRARTRVARNTALNLLMVWISIVLSGVWESVPPAWVAFALILAMSQHVPLLESTLRPKQNKTSHPQAGAEKLAKS